MTPILSIAYFPPISYLCVLAQYGTAYIDIKETFPKQTLRNRTLIATANGTLPLIVPLIRHNHSRTEEVTIDYSSRWNIIHQRTITAAYAASPYYQYYENEINALLGRHYTSLLGLCEATTDWLLKRLKIASTLIYTDDYIRTKRLDLSNELIDYRILSSAKTKIAPLPLQQPYYQVFDAKNGFFPNLSALDLLLNLGPEATNYIKNINISDFGIYSTPK